MSALFAALAAQLVGRRCELPAHTDTWMRGARYGTISRVTARGLTIIPDKLPSARVRVASVEDVKLLD